MVAYRPLPPLVEKIEVTGVPAPASVPAAPATTN